MKRFMIARCLLIVLSLVILIPAFSYAHDVTKKTLLSVGPLQKISNYFSTQILTYSDGTSVSRDLINGPPKPPPGYELERAEVALPEPDPEAGTNTLTVPTYKWVFGCSAVSGSMIAAYYDRNGFPDMYTGPTGGGEMPLTEDASWGTWTDSEPKTYPNNPLIASHNGLDGRATKGSIDDYWAKYGSSASDPYITGAWTQHTWEDAIGDYMKTSQSAYSNTDGSTSFYNYTGSPSQLTCADMVTYAVDTLDGTYGRKLFYEAKGYTVTDCYNQNTDNQYAGGFSFVQYKAEIDAGRPVLLNLDGHSIVGVGYDDASNTVYIHDTWDHLNHTMTWGGSYSNMVLLSVSIVNLEEPTPGMPTISLLSPSTGAVGTSVTIAGTHFGATQDSSTVTFNGLSASITAWSDTLIACTVPEDATTGPVVVTTSLGSSAGRTFTVKQPIISSLSPTIGTVGTPVSISGSYFGATRGSSTVTFNGVEASINTWSNTLITCTVPVGATTGPVIVTTSGGSFIGETFTVKPPAITSLSPTIGTVGTSVSISGSYFGATRGTSTVTFNGAEASITTWSDTRITCTVPVGATTGPVKVTTGAGNTNTKLFTVKPPSIGALSPASGAIGAPVTISGTYFGPVQGSSKVTFNDVEASITTWSNTRITCTVPVGATTGPVKVTTPAGSSIGKTFTVKPPTIGALSPASGAIGAPVTISGTYFGPLQGSSKVTFNDVEASITTWSNTRITCTVPAGATTGPMVVTTPAGGSIAKTFTVKPPTIGTLSPASGAIGAPVTISGTYFGPPQGSSKVTFNDVEASITTWSNTRITCTVPVGATTGPVKVTTPAGSSAGKTFTVKP